MRDFTQSDARKLIPRILAVAERRYGAKCADFARGAFRFVPGIEDPQTEFYGPQKRGVRILLDQRFSRDYETCCYQLAHECIHLLAPTTKDRVTILEEGLATHFQTDFILSLMYPVLTGHKRSTPKEIWLSSGNKRFDNARALYQELHEIDASAIKKLRVDQPFICLITAEKIIDLFPCLHPSTAVKLCSLFNA